MTFQCWLHSWLPHGSISRDNGRGSWAARRMSTIYLTGNKTHLGEHEVIIGKVCWHHGAKVLTAIVDRVVSILGNYMISGTQWAVGWLPCVPGGLLLPPLHLRALQPRGSTMVTWVRAEAWGQHEAIGQGLMIYLGSPELWIPPMPNTNYRCSESGCQDCPGGLIPWNK